MSKCDETQSPSPVLSVGKSNREEWTRSPSPALSMEKIQKTPKPVPTPRTKLTERSGHTTLKMSYQLAEHRTSKSAHKPLSLLEQVAPLRAKKLLEVARAEVEDYPEIQFELIIDSNDPVPIKLSEMDGAEFTSIQPFGTSQSKIDSKSTCWIKGTYTPPITATTVEIPPEDDLIAQAEALLRTSPLHRNPMFQVTEFSFETL